jgi:hypothetical protein
VLGRRPEASGDVALSGVVLGVVGSGREGTSGVWAIRRATARRVDKEAQKRRPSGDTQPSQVSGANSAAGAAQVTVCRLAPRQPLRCNQSEAPNTHVVVAVVAAGHGWVAAHGMAEAGPQPTSNVTRLPSSTARVCTYPRRKARAAGGLVCSGSGVGIGGVAEAQGNSG